jgi:hypothetical protein
MTNKEVRELCERLMRAEAEAEVIALLKTCGYWDDPRCWRHYGDNELNWSQAGGQQARSDFALNEKAVNAIDSLLTRFCIAAGIDPEGSEAPRSIREAVARFVEESGPLLRTTGGRVEDWPARFRSKVAENISIFTTEPPTGATRQTRPCVNIADLGEGQTPEAFPLTLVSLGQRNKISIPFVQGKYCQGGTGALRYCGPNRLQLIVSRRHPEVLGSPVVSSRYPTHATDDQWGLTVVRRESAGENQKMGSLTYLAPLDAETTPRKGRVLRFSAPEMPLFPQGDTAYDRRVAYGTLIKLYEYHLRNSGNILRRNGMRPKIDLLLPDPALPIRFHECRPRVRNDANEQSETMSGLFARLRDNTNVEPTPPASELLTVHGHQLTARIYAFKSGRSDTYRDNEGVIFTVNGQAHGYIKANIFARARVGLQRLAKDLLVVVDCSSLNPTEIDDLFMSSRDRLDEDNPLAVEIEKRIEQVLREHTGLRDLKNRRAQADVAERLSNDKPLELILKQVLKTRPSLSRIFGKGERLQNAFKPENVKSAEVAPLLRPHPTYFRFSDREQGEELCRSAHLKQGCRIPFVTDAEDEYFTRKYDPGIVTFRRINGDSETDVTDYVGPNLVGGKCNITFDLPDDAKIGERLVYDFIVDDRVTQKTFRNRFTLTIAPPQMQKPRKPGKRAQPPGQPPGRNEAGAGGINFPEVFWIKSTAPNWGNHFNDKDDSLDLVDDGDGEIINSVRRPIYKFYLNEDNRSLQLELKGSKRSAMLVKKQYEIGIVLVGLGVIYDHQIHKPKLVNADENGQPEDHETALLTHVRQYTRAIAPILLPMIEGLGGLEDEDIEQSDLVGKA